MANETNGFVPYEQSHELKRLLFVITIVGQGQEKGILQLNFENEAALCVSASGYGTAPGTFYSVFGAGELKKDVVFSILREDKWRVYREQLAARFSVSNLAKGLCFCMPIDSVVGVSIYKMLTNTRTFDKPIRPAKKKKGKKEDDSL